MEGKRAVSRGTQIAMEAFVPWVKQQLDDLLGIPREDERREIVANVKAVMDLWIRHQLNCLLGLQITTVKAVKDDDLKATLDPWLRYRLCDILLLGQEDQKSIVLDLEEELEIILIPRIKPQLKDLLGREEEEKKIVKDVTAELEHVLIPSITHLLKTLVWQQQEDEGLKMVVSVRARLEPVLDIAEAVLQNSDDERRKECAVWEWVDKVMDVGYETVDVLQARSMSSIGNKVSSSVSLKSFIKIGRRDVSASKIKVIISELESLKKEANASGFHNRHYSYIDPVDVDFESLLTGSEIDEFFNLSRKLDKETVLKQLLPRAGEENGVRVISIVGCGGSGKTILAKSLYNDDRLEQQFECRAWVSVSNVFDENRLARDILGSAGNEVKESDAAESLLDLVEECFSGKVFLFVFDDVWTEFESSKWMPFASLLSNGAPGSRILVTTRSEIVARVVGSHWEHTLKPLSNEEWWVLWKDHLLLNDENKISKKIASIGSKIAEKCHGWPLLATAMGDILLHKSTAEEWEYELNKVLEMGDEIWRLHGVAQELFRHFYWSYYKLSPTLKLCILYCADLDKGTVIAVDQLITMWMAQGYLGGPGESDDMKRRNGLKNFNDLASLCFFQGFERGMIHKNRITSCKLDDTFHDFIQYEARHDLEALVQDRYIAVQEKRKERHFHITSYGQVPHNLRCSRWRGVIALVLSSFQLEKVPSEVGCLSRLQYLDLSSNTLKELPETVCDLQSLQFLDVHQCYLLLSLPQRMKKLRQLKHLRIAYTTDELHKHLPPGFEELTLLQTLDVFRTGGRYKDTMKKLKAFVDLLDISIEVHGKVNFPDADLDNKSHLENLELCFVGEGRDPEKASKVMEDFRPPDSLRMLKLENYPLMGLPNWILELPLINNLTRLSIKSALNITILPALWKLSSLEFLRLYDLPNLTNIGREFLQLPDLLDPEMPNQKTSDGHGEREAVIDYIEDDVEISVQELDDFPTVFPSLKSLRIECMKNLDRWEDLNEDEKQENDIPVMPFLEELIIDRCPKLLALPLRVLKDTPWFKTYKP